MKDSKLLKSEPIGCCSNPRGLLCRIAFWLVSAVYIPLATSPNSLASQPNEVHGYEFDDQTGLQTRQYDLKIGFNRALGLPLMNGADAKREPFGSRYLKIDIDLDGDLDLIDFSNAPRVLVWVNEGGGRYLPLIPRYFNLVRVCPSFYESAEYDFLSVWEEAFELSLDSVALGSVPKEISGVLADAEDLTPLSPRAPPTPNK